MERCRICGNEEDNALYHAREMMLGLRHTFDYFQCAACNCLQIAEFPADMTPYYPPEYIGFGNMQFEGVELPGWTVTMWSFPDILAGHATKQPPETVASMSFDELSQGLAKSAADRYLREFVTLRDARILDVGCGSGGFIYNLREIGFTNVMGVDLYIEQDIEHPNGVKVRKGTLHDMEPGWDLIMMHHAFEHMPDPLDTLRAVAERLSPQGVCLIRIPIASSYAWEHYRTNWVQLDAPRHFFLHSLQSLERLAEESGLRLDNSIYDAIPALWASELYSRDISLADKNFFNYFSPTELQSFNELNTSLNQEKRGDQAAFYFVKAN